MLPSTSARHDDNTLRINDLVQWCGAWGSQAPVRARVLGIERTERGEKYGRPVDEMSWADVAAGHAVVTLDNGHWAYGHQLQRVTS